MKILFILLSAMTGFFTGIWIGMITLPDGAGLAGPPDVLFKAVAGTVFFLIISIVLVNKLHETYIKRVVKALTLINIIPMIWLLLRLVL